MNLRQIEVFRATMLAGSVTDAARMLHVSQPGISRMLAHIELQLGVRLFERSRGKLQPTIQAQALFAEVESAYRGVRRINEVARDLRHGGGQTLRVAASPSTALELVPRAVAALAKQFPLARIYMETHLVREMVAQLSAREVDIAVSTLPIDDGLLQSEEIGQWTLACLFAAGHAFEARRSVALRDVMKEPLIAFSADTPQGELIARTTRELGLEPRWQVEVRSGQVAGSLVACGMGVAIVDNLTARALRSGRLAFRPLTAAPVFKAYAARHRNAPQSDMAHDLVTRLRTEFRQSRRQAAEVPAPQRAIPSAARRRP